MQVNIPNKDPGLLWVQGFQRTRQSCGHLSHCTLTNWRKTYLNRRKGYKYSFKKNNYPRGFPQKTIQTRLSQQALCFSLLRLCESLFLRPAGGFGLGSQAANVWFVWKVSGKDEKFSKGKLCGKLFCRHSQKIPFITRSRWWWID